MGWCLLFVTRFGVVVFAVDCRLLCVVDFVCLLLVVVVVVFVVVVVWCCLLCAVVVVYGCCLLLLGVRVRCWLLFVVWSCLELLWFVVVARC